jgi:hypothetical protein
MSDGLEEIDAAVKAIPHTDVDGGLVLLAGCMLAIAGKLQIASVTVRNEASLEDAIRSCEHTRQTLAAVRARLKVADDMAGELIEKLKEYAKDG